jgi:hypothetical protein
MLELQPHQIRSEVIHLSVRPQRLCDYTEETHFFTWFLGITRLHQSLDFLDELFSVSTRYSLSGSATDRDRVVALAIIQWLGTKEGSIFLAMSRLPLKYLNWSLEDIYLELWRRENIVIRGNNSNCTALELIMDTGDDNEIVHGYRKVMPVSSRDYTVAEAVICWLASMRGVNFVTLVEEQIAQDRREASLLHHLRWNLGILAPKGRGHTPLSQTTIVVEGVPA